MTNLINHLKQLDKDGTPSPWKSDGSEYAISLNTADKHSDPVVFGGIGEDESEWGFGNKADAELTVSLRNALPQIISLLEAGEKLREAAGDANNELHSVPLTYALVDYDTIKEELE